MRGLPIGNEEHLLLHRIPEHAVSHADRLLARSEEFAATALSMSAQAGWHDWLSTEITAHDGLVRPNHPALTAVLSRRQSASSLRMLLRNPLGFVWTYALGLREPRIGIDPLILPSNEFGDLFHGVLDRVIRDIEETSNIARIGPTELDERLLAAIASVRDQWEVERSIPPRALWERTLDEVYTLALAAIEMESAHLEGQESHSEIPFGGARIKHDADLPWDPGQEVPLAGTPFKVFGYIDRLDLSEDRTRARVRDYKTGRPIAVDAELDGGKELQRMLYRAAVHAMLGDDVAVEAALLYPRDRQSVVLTDDATVADRLATALMASHASILAGNGLPGTEAGGTYDELQLALPANAANGYMKRKQEAINARLGEAAAIWEAK